MKSTVILSLMCLLLLAIAPCAHADMKAYVLNCTGKDWNTTFYTFNGDDKMCSDEYKSYSFPDNRKIKKIKCKSGGKNKCKVDMLRPWKCKRTRKVGRSDTLRVFKITCSDDTCMEKKITDWDKKDGKVESCKR